MTFGCKFSQVFFFLFNFFYCIEFKDQTIICKCADCKYAQSMHRVHRCPACKSCLWGKTVFIFFIVGNSIKKVNKNQYCSNVFWLDA